MKAAENGNDEIVTLLIKFGARLEDAVEGGDTPLTMAVDNNHLSTVTLLLAWSVEQIVTMSILMVGLL